MAAINYKLLNEDGTELLLETGDSILLENYFYDTILKNSKYAIITTPLPIEKSLQYTLIKSNKIEKGIVYEMKLWPRKILKYCVETTQSIQKGVKYNIGRIIRKIYIFSISICIKKSTIIPTVVKKITTYSCYPSR